MGARSGPRVPGFFVFKYHITYIESVIEACRVNGESEGGTTLFRETFKADRKMGEPMLFESVNELKMYRRCAVICGAYHTP